MTATTNAEILPQYLTVKLMLPFDSSPNMVAEVKNLSANFKQITSQCFTLLNILIGIVRLILSKNTKQLHQTFYPNSLYIVDITCNFL